MIDKGMGMSEEIQESDFPISSGNSPVLDWISKLQSVPVELTPVAAIRPGLDVRAEAGTSADHVRVLMESVGELPAVIVHRSTMRLIDGAHRLAAVRALGHEMIAVRFFEGEDADAYAVAVHSNVVHGLPLSVGERKAAAVRLMRSHPRWSDRLIARTAGLSHKTVGVLRRHTTGADTQSDSRVGGDGKVRPVDADKGRRIAADIIHDRPDASLREISRLAGISPSTVRDVRARLSRGEGAVVVHGESSQIDNAGASRDCRPGPPVRDGDLVLTTPSSGPALRQLREAVTTLQGKIVKSLQNDPALRFNEKGRSILRHVTASVSEIRAWQQFIGDSPSHCHSILARLARANAQSWVELADQLERIERTERRHAMG
ncbi:hypothetical protein OIE68_39770 [Nocardia vinacea]|uniref:ParB/RepB/Spo0J family partition protein n=1 Tax=Nocardia vinacea TaxID=96468 RepID=UPI002E134011|nr:hypothetical protein OIE68_39770 [Nocardia vinacea]